MCIDMKKFYQKIQEAVLNNDFEAAQQYFKFPGFNVNYVSELKGQSLLQIVSNYKGCLPLITKLVDLGANVHHRDSEGATVLFNACAKGCRELVSFLIDRGCNIDQRSDHGDRPIHIAVSSNNKEALMELLARGCDINQRHFFTKMPLLCHAVLHEQEEMVEFLIQNGAKVEKLTPEKESALHFAVQLESSKIIKTLLKHGAKVNRFNCVFETPFILAVNYNKLEFLRILIQHGCHMEKYYHDSAMSVACTRANSDIIRFLLSEGYRIEKDKAFQCRLYPKMEVQFPELLLYLQKICSNPQPASLKELARLRIRQILGPRINVVPTFELPKILEDYVLSDIIY